MELHTVGTRPERALLVGVDTGEYDCEASLQELEALAQTAGAEVVGVVSQRLENPNPATYVGSGRLREICTFCADNDVDLVIADGELSPAQQGNLEKETKTRVIDRTTLILDIFAQHARSREGKIQVELAQLQYRLPRLSGQGKALSRLGGGIGTRGPGESKLESDRRHIRRRIQSLREALGQIEKRRTAYRTRRKKDGVLTVVLMGYTNAGKSTLMNALTNAGVLAEDKLFATLDPTARRLTLPGGLSVMLVDTVGLVRRLPHKLVEAFHSTLEEAADADLILNVCDVSDAAVEEHLQVTTELLEDLGCAQTPILHVFNKCDTPHPNFLPPAGRDTVCISARTGAGIDRLLSAMERLLQKGRARARVCLPFDRVGVLAEVRRRGRVLSEEYLPEGVRAEVIADASLLDALREYVE